MREIEGGSDARVARLRRRALALGFSGKGAARCEAAGLEGKGGYGRRRHLIKARGGGLGVRAKLWGRRGREGRRSRGWTRARVWLRCVGRDDRRFPPVSGCARMGCSLAGS
jgi:hypothetical protein